MQTTRHYWPIDSMQNYKQTTIWGNTEIKRCQNRHEENTWRNTKKLGSLLGDDEDMNRRIHLSTATMQSIAKIWPNKSVKLQDRLKII